MRYFSIGPWTLEVFTLVIGGGILVSAGVGLIRNRKAYPAWAVVDVYLAGLAGGLLGGRLSFVMLNWSYYTYNLDRALRIGEGGLDWHGAVVGGLVGMGIAVYFIPLQNVETTKSRIYADLLDTLTPSLPVLALAGWLGCGAVACYYGAEVENMADYPAFMTADLPDIYGIYVPRFNTQFLGTVFSGGLLALTFLMSLWGRLRYRRFWLALALLSAGMFGIGFLRGDYTVWIAGLRFDQWLDIALLVYGLWQLVFSRPPSVTVVQQSAKSA
jgi:phosphatidylglycerol:prolipoprotein diacylglycerol transferase